MSVPGLTGRLSPSRAEMLPPVLAAWTANIIFLGIGASLFVRART